MLRDLFRGLIGRPPPSFDENNNRDVWADDLFHGFFRDIFDITAQPAEQDDRGDQAEFSDDGIDWDSSHDDFKFSIFSDTQGMFRHFEEQFRRSFQQFGFVDFPPLGPNMPGIGPPGSGMADDDDSGPYRNARVTPRESPQSLRDHLLKQPGSTAPLRDSDLDDSVKDGNVSALLDSIPSNDDERDIPSRRPWNPLSMMPRGGGSFSSSVSVRTMIGSDGSVEERRVIRRPDGTSEETISRRRGDEEHVQVRRCLPDGSVEQKDSNHDTRKDLTTARVDSPVISNRTDSVDDSFWKKLFG